MNQGAEFGHSERSRGICFEPDVLKSRFLTAFEMTVLVGYTVPDQTLLLPDGARGLLETISLLRLLNPDSGSYARVSSSLLTEARSRIICSGVVPVGH